MGTTSACEAARPVPAPEFPPGVIAPDVRAAVEEVAARAAAEGFGVRLNPDGRTIVLVAPPGRAELAPADATAMLARLAREMGAAARDARRKPDDRTVRHRPGTPAVGRNDLCPCGSGRKKKRCHPRTAPAA